MTIANIVINGHTYTDAMWRANWEGTISDIANDIASLLTTLDAVGTLTKAITGNTTLTGAEGQNLLFVFTGGLTANAAITFPAGFSGVATIVNQTTGGFTLVCGLAAGGTVTVPASGSAEAYCDGTDFTLSSGLSRTSGGVNIGGTLAIGGTLTGAAATFSSTLGVTGAVTLSSTLGVTGDTTLSGALNVTGATALTGAVNTTGALTVGTTLTVAGNASVVGTFSSTGAALFGGDVTLNTGTLTVTHTSTETRSKLSAPGGQSAWHQYDASGNQRWLVGRSNDSETGANAGSNFHIVRSDDAGTPTGIPIIVKRDTGYIILGELPTSASGLPSKTLWNNSGALNIAA